MIYQYESGYSSVKFTTEEVDQDGRPLRQIWESLGYRVISIDNARGSYYLKMEPAHAQHIL